MHNRNVFENEKDFNNHPFRFKFIYNEYLQIACNFPDYRNLYLLFYLHIKTRKNKLSNKFLFIPNIYLFEQQRREKCNYSLSINHIFNF